MFMTSEQLEALEVSTGLTYKVRPFIDPKTEKEGFMVGSSYSPDTATDAVYKEALAEQKGKNRANSEKDILDWSQTQKPLAEVNLQKYENIINGVATGNISIGNISDFIPDIAGVRDSVRGFMNPTGQAAVDDVRSIVFLSLKAILGGQFSKDEANRLMDAAYNPALRGEAGVRENINRLGMARFVLQKTYEAKMNELAAMQAGEEYKGPSATAVLASQIDIFSQTNGNSMFLNTASKNKIKNIIPIN